MLQILLQKSPFSQNNKFVFFLPYMNISQHEFFGTKPNALLVSPQTWTTEGLLNIFTLDFKRPGQPVPKVTSHWNGTAFKQNGKVFSLATLFKRTGINLNGHVLRASAVPFQPFFRQSLMSDGTTTEDGIEVLINTDSMEK